MEARKALVTPANKAAPAQPSSALMATPPTQYLLNSVPIPLPSSSTSSKKGSTIGMVEGNHFHPWIGNEPPRGVNAIPHEMGYCEKYDAPDDLASSLACGLRLLLYSHKQETTLATVLKVLGIRPDSLKHLFCRTLKQPSLHLRCLIP